MLIHQHSKKIKLCFIHHITQQIYNIKQAFVEVKYQDIYTIRTYIYENISITVGDDICTILNIIS